MTRGRDLLLLPHTRFLMAMRATKKSSEPEEIKKREMPLLSYSVETRRASLLQTFKSPALARAHTKPDARSDFNAGFSCAGNNDIEHETHLQRGASERDIISRCKVPGNARQFEPNNA
jgi:hypothetical protein